MKDKKEQAEKVPTVIEALNKLARPGSVVEYPEKKIVFNNPQSAVKSLEVMICSTESQNMADLAILHQLHTKTRTM